jgi:hypothetical protein
MSHLLNITQGKKKLPPFMIYYTPPGCGKSTLGASFPKPLFIDFEEGSYEFDVKRLELDSWESLMETLNEILETEAGTLGFESIILDTLDAIEVKMHIQLAKDQGKESIEDIGWQKGFLIALEYWADFIKICKAIRKKHLLNILCLAHAVDIKKEDMYLGAKYSRYGMNLDKRAREYIFGMVDMVLFGRKDISLKKKKDSDVKIAVDQPNIYAHTRLSAHWDAKNRYGMPDKFIMPASNGYDLIKSYIDKAQNETAGMVYKECEAAITRVANPTTSIQMTDYINKNKDDLNVLRAALERILNVIKEEQSNAS